MQTFPPIVEKKSDTFFHIDSLEKYSKIIFTVWEQIDNKMINITVFV